MAAEVLHADAPVQLPAHGQAGALREAVIDGSGHIGVAV